MRNKFSYNLLSKYRGVLMGLAIISILVFHYVEDCRVYEYNYDILVSFFDKYVGSSCVDVFLFMSGFGLYYSFKRNNNVATFYKRRLIKILIPYVIVAMPSWFWRDILFKGADVNAYIRDLFFFSFFDEKVTWFWYIMMIVVCYLIFPYLFEIVETAKDRITEQMRAILLIVCITVIALTLQLCYSNLFSAVNIALLRFPPFFIGCFIGNASYENREIPRSWIVLMVLSIMMLSWRDSGQILIIRYVLAFFNINLFIACAILMEVLERNGLPFKKCKKLLEWFGAHSLELYLTHVAIRGIMRWVGYQTCYLRYEVIMLGLSVLTSIWLKKATNKIISGIQNMYNV